MENKNTYQETSRKSQCERIMPCVFKALDTLNGKDVSNMFGLYWLEMRADFIFLTENQHLDSDLKPTETNHTLIFPNISKSNPNVMRYMWDYFFFIYTSHKTQNIKWRKGFDLPSLLYLRGADYYSLGIKHKGDSGAALGQSTLTDILFQSKIEGSIGKSFNIVKALSPSETTFTMCDLGPYLLDNGNTLGRVGEFAHIRDEGLYLNPRTWKDRIKETMSCASVFLVDVSNQSRGLLYELESLLEKGVENNAVLVLDKDRFTARNSSSSLQDKLQNESEHPLYHSIIKDITTVENTDEFENLLKRFPHTIQLDALSQNSEVLLSLLNDVKRTVNKAGTEIPFQFSISLSEEKQRDLRDFSQFVSDSVTECFQNQETLNLPVALFFLEMNIFLSLLDNRVCDAAASTARYGLLADSMGTYIKEKSSALYSHLGDDLQQHAKMAMSIAGYAYSAGEWNDYEDRRHLTKKLIDDMTAESSNHMQSLRTRSNRSCLIGKRGSAKKPINPNERAELICNLLEEVYPDFRKVA